MSDTNSTALQPFTYTPTNQSINFVKEDDESIWSLGVELCKILGTDSKNIPNILDPDEFKYLKLYYRGQVRRMIFISEPGMWRLITVSRKPIAKKIQRWMFHEVFPTIRKTGSYGHKPQPQFDLTNLDPDAMLETLISVQQLRKQEKARQLELETKLAAQTPVVHAYHRLAAAEGSVCIQEAAKALKMPPGELTTYMLKAGWLYMRPPSKRKIAYQAKIKQGWMVCHEDKKPLSDGRELFFVQYKVTGLGLLRLARELEIDIEEIQ